MPRVIFTVGAVAGLERCRRFLVKRGQQVTVRAAQTIERQLSLLEKTPEIGRPLQDLPALRELMVGFGDSGYVALYRYDPTSDVVHVLAFRHQKEAGY